MYRKTMTLPEWEQKVVDLVSVGLTDDEIATHLEVSKHTVLNCIALLLAELGAEHRIEIVLYAYGNRTSSWGRTTKILASLAGEDVLLVGRLIHVPKSRTLKLRNARTGKPAAIRDFKSMFIKRDAILYANFAQQLRYVGFYGANFERHEISGRCGCVHVAFGPGSNGLEDSHFVRARTGYDNAQVWAAHFQARHDIKQVLVRACTEKHQINVLLRTNVRPMKEKPGRNPAPNRKRPEAHKLHRVALHHSNSDARLLTSACLLQVNVASLPMLHGWRDWAHRGTRTRYHAGILRCVGPKVYRANHSHR